MSRRSSALLVTLALLLPGCMTKTLWRGWAPDPPPTPVAIERAVRTGDGAFHVLARCHDQRVRRLIVRPFARGPGEVEWPDASRAGDDVVAVEPGEELPRGAPLRTEVDADDEAGAVVNDQARIELYDGVLRVEDRAGAWTLATFAPPGEGQPASERLLIIAVTPFALVADAFTLPVQLLALPFTGLP